MGGSRDVHKESEIDIQQTSREKTAADRNNRDSRYSRSNRNNKDTKSQQRDIQPLQHESSSPRDPYLNANGARVLVRAVEHAAVEHVDIVWRHRLRVCQLGGEAVRHADFVCANHRIWRDDRAAIEIKKITRGRKIGSRVRALRVTGPLAIMVTLSVQQIKTTTRENDLSGRECEKRQDATERTVGGMGDK